jgi:hypothetical protein
MKLFEFWTELPASILSMFPELSDELYQFSQMINQWSKKILIAQEIVAGQLNKLEINDLSSEALDSLQKKLQVIENEKTNLSIQGIKATTKILSEVSKYLESLNFPSKDNMTQLKLTLKMTRIIKDKIVLEQGELTINKENCKSLETSSPDSEDKNHLNETKSDIEGFLEMLSVFVDKIQSKLYFKSNQLISSLGKCSISEGSSYETENSQMSFTTQESNSDSNNNNKISNFGENLNIKLEQESNLTANRNYLINIKTKESIKNGKSSSNRQVNLSIEASTLRKEKRKNKTKIVLEKKSKKTSIFSYRTVSSSDSTSDNNSNVDLEKSTSEENIQIKSFQAK